MRCLLSLLFFFICYESLYTFNPDRTFRVMCYNVENYFDCVDDPDTHDEEYLPGGIRGWNYKRYQEKQYNISKVIACVGAWEAPSIVGLCEVESRKSMVDLVLWGPLKNLKYKFVHHESPDFRGIDVALLYQPEDFKLLYDEAIKVSFTDAPHSTTRDILYVMGELPSKDSLHVFVCHFPSRLGGEMESESRRCDASYILRQKIDYLIEKYRHPKIIIMGDFNDYPDNKSLVNVLNAAYPHAPFEADKLYNLMYPFQRLGVGTHKFQAEWGVLDQMIVSGSLLDNQAKIYTDTLNMHIFDADFLLEEDEKFLGRKPLRTYLGMKYTGGYSDHLPIYVDLIFND